MVIDLRIIIVEFVGYMENLRPRGFKVDFCGASSKRAYKP